MYPFDGQRPQIDYPCSWPYRIICSDEAALRSAISLIVGTAEHTLASVGGSPSGRYRRLELVVVVRDEAHRNQIFADLGSAPTVRFVL